MQLSKSARKDKLTFEILPREKNSTAGVKIVAEAKTKDLLEYIESKLSTSNFRKIKIDLIHKLRTVKQFEVRENLTLHNIHYVLKIK